MIIYHDFMNKKRSGKINSCKATVEFTSQVKFVNKLSYYSWRTLSLSEVSLLNDIRSKEAHPYLQNNKKTIV